MQHISQRQPLIDTFLKKNTEINLSAIRDAEWVYIKHVLDSLELQKFFYLQAGVNVIDVWTGGWFPLLPLAISNPLVHFVWLDSVRKKTDVVATMASALWLQNISMVRSRAEDHHEVYDILTARAMAFSDKLFSWTYHLVKKWWHFVLYKMFSEEEESWIDSYALQRKMTILHKHYYKLFDDDIQRVIYVLQK
jgi:16S rRNA (guanine527-N7)-methyltransferase